MSASNSNVNSDVLHSILRRKVQSTHHKADALFNLRKKLRETCGMDHLVTKYGL